MDLKERIEEFREFQNLHRRKKTARQFIGLSMKIGSMPEYLAKVEIKEDLITIEPMDRYDYKLPLPIFISRDGTDYLDEVHDQLSYDFKPEGPVFRFRFPTKETKTRFINSLKTEK